MSRRLIGETPAGRRELVWRGARPAAVRGSGIAGGDGRGVRDAAAVVAPGLAALDDQTWSYFGIKIGLGAGRLVCDGRSWSGQQAGVGDPPDVAGPRRASPPGSGAARAEPRTLGRSVPRVAVATSRSARPAHPGPAPAPHPGTRPSAAAWSAVPAPDRRSPCSSRRRSRRHLAVDPSRAAHQGLDSTEKFRHPGRCPAR